VTGSLASVFMSRCPWQDGAGMRDESLGPGRPGSFATGSPRPVESRNRCEAGLLACTVQALIRQGPGGMTPSRAWAQWLCRSVAGTYSCGGSRGLYRVPVLASVWPKNLEAARLRGGWRVVNSWLEICRALATERRPQPHQPIDATPAPCSPYTLRSGAPTGVKRETGASQARPGPDNSGAAPATVSERSV